MVKHTLFRVKSIEISLAIDPQPSAEIQRSGVAIRQIPACTWRLIAQVVTGHRLSAVCGDRVSIADHSSVARSHVRDRYKCSF